MSAGDDVEALSRRLSGDGGKKPPPPLKIPNVEPTPDDGRYGHEHLRTRTIMMCSVLCSTPASDSESPVVHDMTADSHATLHYNSIRMRMSSEVVAEELAAARQASQSICMRAHGISGTRHTCHTRRTARHASHTPHIRMDGSRCRRTSLSKVPAVQSTVPPPRVMVMVCLWLVGCL